MILLSRGWPPCPRHTTGMNLAHQFRARAALPAHDAKPRRRSGTDPVRTRRGPGADRPIPSAGCVITFSSPHIFMSPRVRFRVYSPHAPSCAAPHAARHPRTGSRHAQHASFRVRIRCRPARRPCDGGLPVLADRAGPGRALGNGPDRSASHRADNRQRRPPASRPPRRSMVERRRRRRRAGHPRRRPAAVADPAPAPHPARPGPGRKHPAQHRAGHLAAGGGRVLPDAGAAAGAGAGGALRPGGRAARRRGLPARAGRVAGQRTRRTLRLRAARHALRAGPQFTRPVRVRRRGAGHLSRSRTARFAGHPLVHGAWAA